MGWGGARLRGDVLWRAAQAAGGRSSDSFPTRSPTLCPPAAPRLRDLKRGACPQPAPTRPSCLQHERRPQRQAPDPRPLVTAQSSHCSSRAPSELWPAAAPPGPQASLHLSIRLPAEGGPALDRHSLSASLSNTHKHDARHLLTIASGGHLGVLTHALPKLEAARTGASAYTCQGRPRARLQSACTAASGPLREAAAQPDGSCQGGEHEERDAHEDDAKGQHLAQAGALLDGHLQREVARVRRGRRSAPGAAVR